MYDKLQKSSMVCMISVTRRDWLELKFQAWWTGEQEKTWLRYLSTHMSFTRLAVPFSSWIVKQKKATHLSWRNKDATPICARTFFTHRVTDLLKRLPERELAASQSTLLETGCIMKKFYFLGIRQSFRFWITETTSGFSAGLAQWPVAWVFFKESFIC